MPITPAKKKNITMWLVIGAVVIASLAIVAALYYSGLFVKDCKVLERRNCDKGTPIVYDGQPAMAFNLPGGTKIYSPFDGGFFEENEDRFNRGAVGVIDTSIFFKFVGLHSPAYKSGTIIEGGDEIALLQGGGDPIDADTNSNLVIYFAEANLSDYFSLE